MIGLNQQRTLPGIALAYFIVISCLVSLPVLFVGIAFGAVLNIAGPNGSCTGSAQFCSFFTSGNGGWVVFGGFLILYLVLTAMHALYQILWYLEFSYTLSERALTVNSGIIFRQSKTIDLDRVQNVDNTRGPLQMAFGLTSVNVWTASQDQIGFDGHGNRVTRPETRIYLLQQDAQELKDYISQKAAVQEVKMSSV